MVVPALTWLEAHTPLLGLLGLLVVWGWALRRLRRALRGRAGGRVVATDGGGTGLPGTWLESRRLRLRGRPDEIRRGPDGRYFPVEIKSRPAPHGAPLASHRLQLLAYCALLEEATGVPPPFGLLVYGDGREIRVPWDPKARRELSQALARIRGPYRGEMRPAYPRCSVCRFRSGCPGAQEAGIAPEGSRRGTSGF